jgi:hypothetical protein
MSLWEKRASVTRYMKKYLKYFLFWLEGSPWAIPCCSYVRGWWSERVHNLETRDISIYCSAGKTVLLVLPFCFIPFLECSFCCSWYPAYSSHLPISAHSEVFTGHALSRLRIMDFLVQLACTKADHTGSTGFSGNNTRISLLYVVTLCWQYNTAAHLQFLTFLYKA